MNPFCWIIFCLLKKSDICFLKKDCNTYISLTNALQKDDTNIAEVRVLLDEIILQFPKMDPNLEYIPKSAQSMKNQVFENGLVKILDRKEAAVTVSERIV